MKYDEFPLPLHDISGDVTLYTDLKTDSFSHFEHKRIQCKNTPVINYYQRAGKDTSFRIFIAILKRVLELTLDEFNPIIPDSMKLNLKGKASGMVQSAFSLSQMEKMQLEKIKLSGSVTLSDFKVSYDSIYLNTDRSAIDFALPNYAPSSKNTKFAFASIIVGQY